MNFGRLLWRRLLKQKFHNLIVAAVAAEIDGTEAGAYIQKYI